MSWKRNHLFFPNAHIEKCKEPKTVKLSPHCVQACRHSTEIQFFFLQCRKIQSFYGLNGYILLFLTPLSYWLSYFWWFHQISSNGFFQTFAFKKAVKICRTSTLKNEVNLIWRVPTSLPIFIPSLETHGFIKRNNYMFIPEREIE